MKQNRIQFSKTVDTNIQFVDRNTELQNTLLKEQQEWAAIKANQEVLGSQKLGEVFVPLAKCTFKDLFEMRVTNAGLPLLVVNPKGTNGGATSLNSGADVNALRDAFGLGIYGTLQYGLHERRFNRASLKESNVRSIEEDGKWQRYSWVKRNFVKSTPKVFTPWEGCSQEVVERARANKEEYERWTAKHNAIDMMIASILSGQAYFAAFSDPYHYDRLVNNVLNMMDTPVSDVIVKANALTAGAQQARVVDQMGASADIATMALVIDKIDIRGLVAPFRIHVDAPFGSFFKTLDPTKDWALRTVAGYLMNPQIKVQMVQPE